MTFASWAIVLFVGFFSFSATLFFLMLCTYLVMDRAFRFFDPVAHKHGITHTFANRVILPIMCVIYMLASLFVAATVAGWTIRLLGLN